MRNGTARRTVLAALGWSVLVFACTVALLWESQRPGPKAESPIALPASMAAHRTDGLATVFIAIHPRCPCTRATIGNLERALNVPSQSWKVVALIYTPPGAASDWAATDTVERVTALNGALAVKDIDGRAAGSLGMRTSGQVVCYDRDGYLAFSGGITPSRGHEGDCAGLAGLCDALTGHAAPLTAPSRPLTTAVYGCPLCNDPALSICGVQPDGLK